MAQALIFNGTTGRVDIPTKVGSGGARRLLLAEFLSVSDFSNRCIVGNSLGSTDGSIRFKSTTQLGVRINGGPDRTVTVSPAFQTASEFTLEVFVNAGNTVSVNVNGSQVGSAAIASAEFNAIDNYQYIGQCGNSFRLNATVKRMVVLETEYLNASGDGTETTWGDGTLNDLTPPGCWTAYNQGTTPVVLDIDPAAESSTGGDMSFTWPVTGFTLDVEAANEPSAGADMEFITGQGTVVSQPLYLNTDQPTGLLANTLLTYVALYDVDTGELVARFTNITTDADGRYTITSHLITTGVSYRHDWQNSVNGASKMPVSVAA